MLQKRWTLKETNHDFAVSALADSLNIPEVLSGLLVQRGVNNFYDAKKFFRPSLDFLYDPFLMNGMEEATSRVIKAITENELICVYGDYDVDGTCATALLYMFLKELDAKIEFYIPQRLIEGYGISKTGIENIHDKGASLLISVDCGITAIDETSLAKSYGIDVIICDHHHPKEELPNAFAILDPIKPGCNYPFKFLSGAGVAFKLAQGIAERIGKRELPFKYLDLVSLAAAADIVSLTDENRILVREGLNLINSSPRAGIKALIEKCSINPGSLSSGQVVFTLAPRINAVGRLGDAKRAVDLLTTDKLDEAFEFASVLENENYERRKIDVDTFDSALELIASSVDLENEIPIILHQEDWHPGVIGIVASRIVEKYYRPTIMLTTVDGIAKGSARSINNFNIYEALQKCEELLIHFGGHQAAAGLAVELENLDEFKYRFNQIVKDSINDKDLSPELMIDSKIKFSEITPKFIRILEQFSPFGPGNMRPVFLAEGVSIVSNPRIVGANHLIVSLKQNSINKVFDSVGFNMGEYLDSIKNPGVNFDIVFSIDKLIRDGKEFPQLKLKDLKIN
ncbi:MAG TPA: single-stranded-DNA-specific exonuclease RecJ [Ignavibacteriaceae bacterium]|nr:single-stranded-DNA-specific exonuclease RecJ [Ignavibacteriaceae bacterium]